MTRFMDFIIFQSQRDYRPSSPHVVLTTDRNSTGETETGHTNAFIFILLWMDGWTNRQAVKVTKKYINVILLTFLSIKSKTISAIAKHIIRLGHHYYRSLCTHIPSVCGSVQYVWSFGDISSGRALFGAVWTDKKPEMWGWCGLGHADCTELTPGLIKFSSAACNRWVQEI